MIGLSPTLPKKIIQSAAFEARYENLKDFFRLRQYMIDFYEVNQTALGEYLKDWGFKEKDQLPLTTIELTKSVIDRTAMVYKTPPTRILLDKSGKDTENEGYAELIEDCPDFNPLMKRLEKYRKLLKNVILRPEYHPDEECYRFYIETEYVPQYGLWDNLHPIGYHFFRYGPTPRSTDPEEHFVYISKTEIFGHYGAPEVPGERFAVGDNDDGTHNLGVMPVIDYSPPPVTDYWTLGRRGLVDANRSLLVALLTTDYAHQFQSFDQPWVRGLQSTELSRDVYGQPEMKVGPDETWNLGDEGEAGLLSPNPQLVESMEYIERKLNISLYNYHVQANFKPSGQPMSGFALRVLNIPLLEERQAK